MFAMLSNLMLASAPFNPLPDCELARPVTFSEDLRSLPPAVEEDFQRRAGHVNSRLEAYAALGEVPRPGQNIDKLLLYVGQADDRWLISYEVGGRVVQYVTVSYRYDERDRSVVLLGALNGGLCTTANAFLQGVSVERGWER